ncbi:MAG: nitroreductase [Nitrospira sp.]|nr:nitroreductase [Nitrospira sp.]
MDIPYPRWYPAISARRSRRLFDSNPIPPDILEKFTAFCSKFQPFDGVRTAIITDSLGTVFKGLIGHYGKIKGAPAAVVFIGDMGDANVLEKIGYMGEGIILEATYLGLGTCWVGGFFKPEVAASIARIRKQERVFAVTPVGFAPEKVSLEEKIMTSFGRTHKRKPLHELVTGMDETRWPEWMKTALEAARIAPSAVNRQPWRFHIENNSITILVDNLKDTYSISKRIDCGIAMLHIEIASLYSGIKGEWQFLNAPEVARFKVM